MTDWKDNYPQNGEVAIWDNRIVRYGDAIVADLLANPFNARIHGQAQQAHLLGSLASVGIVDTICINERTGHLVDGHLRMVLADRHGIETLPARWIDVSEDEEKFILATFDWITAEADTDRDVLDSLLQQLQADDNTMQGVVEDDERLQDMLSEMAQEHGLTFGDEDVPEDVGAQIDRAAELQEQWQVQSGDLYIIPSITGDGQHRLLCGDSTKADDVSRVMDGGKANGCFTSPPYAEQRKKQYGGIPADEYVKWWADIQQNVRSVIHDDGSFFVNIKASTTPDYFERVLYVYDLVLAMKRQWGWFFIDEFCWLRIGVPKQVTYRFKNAFEPVFHFVPKHLDFKIRPNNVKHVSENAMILAGKGSGHNYGPADGYDWDGAFHHLGTELGLAFPSNVLKIFNTENYSGHAAPFPVALPEFFINAYSDVSDLWFDPFAGSGTTAVACEQLQRQCRMIEIAPKYCAVILERMVGLGCTPVKAAQ